MADLMTNPIVRTLYDDWQARRARLSGAEDAMSDYHAVEIRLLDYLLRRYKDSPEAARPALFPLLKSAYINHRAIVVHHHLGRGSIPTISNRREAYAHVRSMIEHMWTPAAGEEGLAADDTVPKFVEPPKIDPVETVREKLCDVDPAVRVQAAVELGEIGSLDDIGLLSDLLSLPYSLDEHPKERAALVHAMQRLSGTTTEEFDLSGIPPVLETPTNPDPENLDSAASDEPPPEFEVFRILRVLACLIFAMGAILFALAFLMR
jgi:hypothetical protein